MDALGMEISSINSRVLVSLTCLVTAYFLAAFILYYRADHFAASHSVIGIVNALTEKLMASDANENIGMTKERFGQVVPVWWDLQLKRHLYPRYRFEFWSASLPGAASIVSALVWLLRNS